MSAMWEAQKSLYNILANDLTFMNLINNRLYDEPQTNTAYPYVVIGDMTEEDDNRLILKGYEITATMHIFTQPSGLGYYTPKKIYERMNFLLNCKKPTLDTLKCVICKLDNTTTERDKDYRVLNVRYRLLIHDDSILTF
jgi:hypothetical protein